MKQKTAKPGEPIADASTEIGGENIEIPDISKALKAAQEAKQETKRTRRKRVICPQCGVPSCPYGYYIEI